MSEDNKIVPFPSHKIKKSQNEALKASEAPVTKGHRGSLIISLFATVLIATVLTNQLSQNSQGEGSRVNQGREIASAEIQRSFEEDLLLARKIARQSLREPASRGREPSAQDILQHVELAGLYRLSFDEVGALTGVDYASTKGGERFVEDRVGFLVRNADLLRIQFDTPAAPNTIPSDNQTLEVYDLMKNGELKARVHFVVDQNDRFYSMKVENI